MKNIYLKISVFIILVVFYLSSCSRGNAQVIAGDEHSASAAAEETKIEETQSAPKFVLIPESAQPGEFITIGYEDTRSAENLRAVLYDSRGRLLTRAAFFNLDEEPKITSFTYEAAVLAIPSTALPGSAVISIESEGRIIQELPITIERREFRAETIYLDERNTELRTVPDPQKTAESEQLWAILSHSGKVIFTQKQFIAPVASTRRTSAYGNRRVYQYSDGTSDTTIHAGVDIGVPTGTEVFASGQGRVVLARPRIVTGNTVVLEHLPGIYSLYYHLDSISVDEDAIIEAGSVLGRAGATGLATGPHLHWEIRVSGENADPDFFLNRAILDKNDLIGKIRNKEQ